MLIRKLFFALAAFGLLAATGSQASAQCGGGAYGWGAGYWDIGNLYRLLADRVPYYAAFPPVYYSFPVPRTYGHSPFAYLPTHETPDVEVLPPLAIENPYFRPSAEAADQLPAESQDKVTAAPSRSVPLVIHNPHYRATPAENGPFVQAAALRR